MFLRFSSASFVPFHVARRRLLVSDVRCCSLVPPTLSLPYLLSASNSRNSVCVCASFKECCSFIYDDEFPMLSGLQLPISGNNRPTLQSPPRLLKYSLIVMDPDYYLLACPLAFPCLPEEVHVGREYSFIPFTTDVVLGDTIFCLQ